MKKRNKKYNPQKRLAYQRLSASDLTPFFGEFNDFFQNLLINKFKYKKTEHNDVILKKIYVVTYIYNELEKNVVDKMNHIRDIINKAFTLFYTTNRDEYIFTENEYNDLKQLIIDCYKRALFMIRKKWAYYVAVGCEYMEMSFKIKLPPIGHYIDVEEMNQTLLKLFIKDGYINANYLS